MSSQGFRLVGEDCLSASDYVQRCFPHYILQKAPQSLVPVHSPVPALCKVTPCYSNSVLDDSLARVLTFCGGIRLVFCACGNMLRDASSWLQASSSLSADRRNCNFVETRIDAFSPAILLCCIVGGEACYRSQVDSTGEQKWLSKSKWGKVWSS